MVRICKEEMREEGRLISHMENEAGEDEEEALSLSDFPVDIIREECRGGALQEDSDFDFDFESMNRVGSGSMERVAMSTADELFFEGRILPLRHSVSSDAGSTRPSSDQTADLARRLLRSESVDFRRTGPFGNGESTRSSSSWSHYSSSTSGTVSTSGGESGSEPKVINNFMNYSHRSPQPQIRRAFSMNARVSTSRNSRFSIWDILRLSLVRAPEIELQHLKARNTSNQHNLNRSCVSRNSSCSSTTATTSNSSIKVSKLTDHNPNELVHPKQRKQRQKSGGSDRKSWFSFSDCKFSAKATAETAPSRSHENEMAEETKKKEKKKALSRNRIAEWLKELPHESFAGHASFA